MQRRIQPLSQQLANQIAAGEVVERPASVVKELLENSIDAGATRIELELEQGGSKRIRVLDDGTGIHRDDLALAVSPHATSKIYNQQELEQIASLGFRGEALASIASVCRFTLSSHLLGEEGGWQISNDGKGGLSTPVPCAMPVGTSVEVRDLFFNTPARRKFLRSERTEFLHVEEVLRRAALSRFDVAFSLLHNGRQTLRLRPAQDEAQKSRRVADVLGKEFLRHAMTLEFEAAGMRLWGWLSSPDYSRSHADSQYFYLNGRIIRDKLVTHAIRQGFQSVLEPGRHPAYLLNLELDPRTIDINVHPTKHEVRFRESRLVHDFIYRSLLNALTGPAQASHTEQLPAAANTERVESPVTSAYVYQGGGTGRQGTQKIGEQQALYRQPPLARIGNKRHAPVTTGPLGKAQALLHGRYLLAQNAEGPLLLDLDAAREYLLLRRVQVLLADGEVQSQPLLIPVTLTLDESVIATLEPGLGELLRLGFVLERLGAESLILREVPAVSRGADAELLLRRLVTLMQGMDGPLRADDPGLVRELVRATVATARLEHLAEAERVLRELESLADTGRSFWKPLPVSQLAQWLESPG